MLVASADPLLRHNLLTDPNLSSVTSHAVESAQAAFLEVEDERYDLAVLDDRLPGAGVDDLLSGLRSHHCGVLVVCSDRSDVAATMLLDAGADDVVLRPYSTPELGARVRAILRRRASTPKPRTTQITRGSIQLHVDSRLVVIRGQRLHIPPLEFAVLLALQARDGIPVPRGVLLDECWSPAAVRRPHYVDSVVRRLRVRLEVRPSNPEHLVTVRSKGYAWLP